MAAPTSGELSLGKIRQELETSDYSAGPYTTNATSLSGSETGLYATINTSSSSYPDGTTPYAMSEWYSYDQSTLGPMPTITGYSGTGQTSVGGFSGASFPAYTGVKLTDTKYIGIAVKSERSINQDVYAHGIDWSSTSPTVNSLSVIDSNGFSYSGRIAGIAIAKLTNSKAVTFYQQGSTTIRIQIISYSGGTNSVTVDASTTNTTSGGFSSGQAINFASSGDDHYIALSSCNPNTNNFDAYIKIFKINSSTNTVTYITQGQINTGADNNAKVISYGEISTNTYGLLGLCLNNTSLAGNLRYATMKFNISTETLTVSTNINTLNATSCRLTQANYVGIPIREGSKIIFTYNPDSGGIRTKQACISYDGTTTTVESNSNDGTIINHFITHYLIDNYTTPEDQMIHFFRDTSINQSWRVETVIFNNSTNLYTRQNDEHAIIGSTSTYQGGEGQFIHLKDPSNAFFIWANRDTDNIQYGTFTINS